MAESSAVRRMVLNSDANPRSMRFMLERGVDLSENQETQPTPEMVESADLVVAILEQDQNVDYLARVKM